MRTRVLKVGDNYIPQYYTWYYLWKSFTYLDLDCTDEYEEVKYEFPTLQEAIDFCRSQTVSDKKEVVWDSNDE